MDGAHIRLLLLTFLYRYQRELIERGFVYIACPPLYKVTFRDSKTSRSDRTQYCYTDEQYGEFIATMERQSRPVVGIQRFKGLGEMMPTELWQTTMDPSVRLMKRVKASEFENIDRLLTTLMGTDAQLRKAFISENAKLLTILDLDY